MSHLVRLADVDPVEIEWLWRPWLPRGRLTIIEGDPGIGKSFLVAAIAAAVSTGTALPSGSDTASPANILMLSVEDGIADTIRPRLDALEADPKNIYTIGDLSLGGSQWLKQLVGVLAAVQPALIILDPLQAFMSAQTDMHRANETRQAMMPIAAIAERAGAALIAVRHLSKSSSGKAIYRGLGSIDITASARSVIHVAGDPDRPGNGAIFHIKSNISELAEPIGYSITEGQFRWTGPTSLSIEDLTVGQASSMSDAKAFLMELLADGPRPATEVTQRATDEQISMATLRRARGALGVRSNREGFGADGKWIWSLSVAASTHIGS